jgi:hypothetical protein
MQITVTKTGGFAGLHQQLGPVDTSRLDPEVADQVLRIITELDFFNLPKSLPGSPVADGFHYTVQVSEDTRDHTVETEGLSDDPAVLKLHELIGALDQAVGYGEHPSGLPDGVVDTHSWSAWYNRMPGSDDPDLHVSGTCGLASSSIEVRLELGNVGVVPEPGLCALQLAVTRPEVGDTRYVEREVTWHGDVGPAIERVRINNISVEIPVTIAQ